MELFGTRSGQCGISAKSRECTDRIVRMVMAIGEINRKESYREACAKQSSLLCVIKQIEHNTTSSQNRILETSNMARWM